MERSHKLALNSRIDFLSSDYIFYVQKMIQSRSNLPIFAAKDELIHQIRNNDVVIVCGETGSGKTTQVGVLLKEIKIHVLMVMVMKNLVPLCHNGDCLREAS